MARSAVLTVPRTSPRFVAWAGFLLFNAAAAAAAPIEYVTGPKLLRQLEQPVTIAWSNVSFREAIASLSTSQRLAVVVDRRVDPDKPFSLKVAEDPLRLVILKIAEQKAIGSSILGPVVYFGPNKAAESLKTLAALRRDDVLQSPPGVKKLLAQSRPLAWDDLAEPRQLITSLAKEVRVKIDGLSQIPHDLWPANSLPSLPWSDRVTLILIQFGLTFQLADAGQSIAIVPIPNTIQITRNHPGGSLPSARAKKLQSQIPAAKISVQGEKIVVVGRMEDQETVAQLLSGRKVQTTTVKSGQDVYKLNVEGIPLEKVLTQLSAMLKLELKYDREAIQKSGVALNQLITFRVEDASLDELLSAALKGTGLAYERRDKTVTITVR